MSESSQTSPAAPPAAADYPFVRRPVMAVVISLAITLLGAVALRTLAVNRYPQITPPAVQVTAVYPGASAQDVADAVAAPIEQQLDGLEGLLYYASSSTSDGVMNLTLTFDIARDQDLAAVDVQNAINLATPQLPAAVRQDGVTIFKANSDVLLVGALTSDDPRYDAAFLSNYVTLYLLNELKRVPGVGNATAFGTLDFSMLLDLDPERMARLGITVDDVAGAVQAQNATKPGGRIGREPAPAGTELTVPVTTAGRLTTPEEFGAIVVRARPDGSIVHVRDVAAVRLGSRGYDVTGRLNGRPTALFAVYTRPGGNSLAVKNAVTARLAELAQAFPPGVRWSLPFDTTPFITESVREVVITLVEAMALVVAVVFAFLQDWRATLIPVLAVPVSIVGTFLGLKLFGFTVNTLTLFAMVLAIGIVVDDAIVVIENVQRLMRDERLTPRAAASRAMRQVAGALVAIVLVLCSVFVPVAFVGGITGRMYTQFAVTIATAVVLSGAVALTLTPALCATLLKPARPDAASGAPGTALGGPRPFRWFTDHFNRGFDRLATAYTAATGRVVAHPRAWLAGFALVVGLVGLLYTRVPGGFLPNEDKGYFAVSVRLPDAASLQRTGAVARQVEDVLRREPGVRNVVTIAGLDVLAGANQTNAATCFVDLKPWGDRKGAGAALPDILARVNGAFSTMPQAVAFGFNLPEIPGLGTSSGLEVNLQQRTGGDVRALAGQVETFTADANRSGVVRGADASLRTDVPQVYVRVDEDAAQALGVSTAQVFSTLQAMLSTLYVNDFTLYGRPYRVQAEALAAFRQRPEDVGRFYVRSRSGAMVPVSAVARTEMRSAPTQLTRFNGFPSARVTATPAPGVSSGAMLDWVDRTVATKYSARGIAAAYSGESYQEKASAGQGLTVLGLGLVLVFLVLAAQYESWSVPFAVLLALPFGVLGALLGALARGLADDVYFQVGIITVVGLAAKNAILIVEFANGLVAQGKSVRDAAVQAARERFRPILMTSFAFVLGVAPLLTASGAGAASRHSLGTGVFFGMLSATLLGVLFVPLFFTVIRSASGRRATRDAATPASAAVVSGTAAAGS